MRRMMMMVVVVMEEKDAENEPGDSGTLASRTIAFIHSASNGGWVGSKLTGPASPLMLM